ncbi:MAG: pyridoxal-phosphate dependent enzyme, partial [Oscillatoriales cyanobacterium]
MIYNSILETIGQTPVIKLQKIIDKSLDSKFAIYIKNETFNPGGSHKTRIAFNMIKDAEKQGILKPNTGQTILEPTGGNTGMGIAIAAAILGYNVILVIPDNYSSQKQKSLKA